MIPSGMYARFAGLRRVATAAVACSIAVCSSDGFAQITSGSGSEQQESRASAMGTQPGAAAPTVHESQAPQSKDAAGKNRGVTAGKGHKTEGAGGFNNGLYGTGAGSNK
jgi:hypothetical protein